MNELVNASGDGLRARQKLLRIDAIIKAASKLFREHGYEKVSIELIAENALVSPATVYNYFGTKSAILLEAIEHLDVAIAEDLKEMNLRDDLGPAAEEITEYLASIVKASLDGLGRNAWQHAFVSKQLNHKSRLGEGYKIINSRMYGHLEGYLASLIAQGRLDPNIDADLMRQMLEQINHTFFSEMLADDKYNFKQYRSNLCNFVTIIIAGCERTAEQQ